MITIKQLGHANENAGLFNGLAVFCSGNTYYNSYDLLEYFRETKVRKMFVAEQVIIDINIFIEKHLEEKPVKEVGGFLMGYYEQMEIEYDVCVDLFLPDTVTERNTATHLTFSHQINQHLDELLEQKPHYTIVGWFHTHPGHTPFLSKVDLNSNHYLFFRKPYQIAIVTDSLTEDFATGIFSWQNESEMNDFVGREKWVKFKR